MQLQGRRHWLAEHEPHLQEVLGRAWECGLHFSNGWKKQLYMHIRVYIYRYIHINTCVSLYIYITCNIYGLYGLYMIVHYLLRQWDAHASRASMDLAMAGHVHCTLDDLEKMYGYVWIIMHIFWVHLLHHHFKRQWKAAKLHACTITTAIHQLLCLPSEPCSTRPSYSSCQQMKWNAWLVVKRQRHPIWPDASDEEFEA